MTGLNWQLFCVIYGRNDHIHEKELSAQTKRPFFLLLRPWFRNFPKKKYSRNLSLWNCIKSHNLPSCVKICFNVDDDDENSPHFYNTNFFKLFHYTISCISCTLLEPKVKIGYHEFDFKFRIVCKFKPVFKLIFLNRRSKFEIEITSSFAKKARNSDSWQEIYIDVFLKIFYRKSLINLIFGHKPMWLLKKKWFKAQIWKICYVVLKNVG